MKNHGSTAGLQVLRLALFGILTVIAPLSLLSAQEPDPETTPTPDGPPVTVRGVVLNASTGHPLARALVEAVVGQPLGALTDGEGRFQIHGVPPGMATFQVIKPGFGEQLDDDPANSPFRSHSIQVASDMPELTFSLSPKNAIYGRISLSTGTPALGIGIILVRQVISGGRAVWTEKDRHQTTPDGSFRFAGLSDGTYLLMTEPEFDNDRATALEPRCNADAPRSMPGYAVQFYSSAPEMAGAARIVLSGGESVEANLQLTLTSFHLVQIAMVHPPADPGWDFSNVLLDHTGQSLEYPLHEEKNHTLCAYLPDGSYMLTGQVTPPGNENPRATAVKEVVPTILTGLLEFSVDGHPARDLRLPLAQASFTPIHLRYEPAPPPFAKTKPQSEDDETGVETEPLSLHARQVNSISSNQLESAEAWQTGPTTYQFLANVPGPYWIQASASAEGVCLGSVTAGGQNLASVPWVAGPSAAGTPIDVVLRTDCATLTVQAPPALSTDASDAFLTVYAVPEFDSIEGFAQGTITLSGDRTTDLQDMTPGTYRVYALRSPRSIEFHNPAALDRLGPGKQITLEPGAHATLVLEGVSQ